MLKGITPLCLAAYLGKLNMVRCLLEEGANVDAADRNGATALMYAGKLFLYLKKNCSIRLLTQTPHPTFPFPSSSRRPLRGGSDITRI